MPGQEGHIATQFQFPHLPYPILSTKRLRLLPCKLPNGRLLTIQELLLPQLLVSLRLSLGGHFSSRPTVLHISIRLKQGYSMIILKNIFIVRNRNCIIMKPKERIGWNRRRDQSTLLLNTILQNQVLNLLKTFQLAMIKRFQILILL